MKKTFFSTTASVTLALHHYSYPEICGPSVKLQDEPLSLFYVEFVQKQRRHNLGRGKIGDARLSWRCPQCSISNYVAVICTQMLHLLSFATQSQQILFSLCLLAKKETKKCDFDGLTVRTTERCAALCSNDRFPQNGFRNMVVTCPPWFIICNLIYCCLHIEHFFFFYICPCRSRVILGGSVL